MLTFEINEHFSATKNPENTKKVFIRSIKRVSIHISSHEIIKTLIIK